MKDKPDILFEKRSFVVDQKTKIIKGFCMNCQKRQQIVCKLPIRRYWAYCLPQQAFANYKYVP